MLLIWALQIWDRWRENCKCMFLPHIGESTGWGEQQLDCRNCHCNCVTFIGNVRRDRAAPPQCILLLPLLFPLRSCFLRCASKAASTKKIVKTLSMWQASEAISYGFKKCEAKNMETLKKVGLNMQKHTCWPNIAQNPLYLADVIKEAEKRDREAGITCDFVLSLIAPNNFIIFQQVTKIKEVIFQVIQKP